MRRVRFALGAAVGAVLLLTTGCALTSDDDAASVTPESSAATAPTDMSTDVHTPVPTQAPAPATTPTRDPLADLAESIEIDEGPVLGSDISWPQCPPGMGIPEKRSHGGPGPVPEAKYVILGLTNGPGFYPNPCLADQLADAKAADRMVAAYAVASYPEQRFLDQYGADGPYDGATAAGALANTGYQQARFNVDLMKKTGLRTPIVWIDVEPVPDFEWTDDLNANAAVVAGIARGYEDAGYRIGVYSTPALWAGVVGNLELGIPEWRAAGQTSADEALSRCGDDWIIQGGQAVLGQWVEADRDMNLTCPGISVDLANWFHRY
ncbi:hypothetical protein [Nocardioides sp. GXZ039]|uniref:hypothetical protein n=1 Tax=Nocardioides sp. GXZ039 TaxID=3136018 RepID=UPI0030F3ECD3